MSKVVWESLPEGRIGLRERRFWRHRVTFAGLACRWGQNSKEAAGQRRVVRGRGAGGRSRRLLL